MSSFQEFWNDGTDHNQQPSGATPELVPLSITTQTSLALGITAITTAGLALFSDNNKQAQAEKFSVEVSQYVTSNEVVSEVSNNVGLPKQDESEDEFVERASTALRDILRKKFNV